MGLMPPYDPFGDPSLAWAVCRVRSIDPPSPTWARPARVVLDVTEVLRGEVPATVEVTFGSTREASQSYFYVARGLGPPPHSPEALARAREQEEALGRTPVEVPTVGTTIVVWLAHAPPGPQGPPGPPDPLAPSGTPASPWDIPTLRSLGMAIPRGMRSRWLEADAETIALVRSRAR